MISEEEAIKILRENNIEVIMKPVALVPVPLYFQSKIGSVEYEHMDIYRALNTLENRKKLTKDPFS